MIRVSENRAFQIRLTETMTDKQNVFHETHLLRRAISTLANEKISLRDREIRQLTIRNAVTPQPATPVDVVICPNEVTQLHGTGVLIFRIFGKAGRFFQYVPETTTASIRLAVWIFV